MLYEALRRKLPGRQAQQQSERQILGLGAIVADSAGAIVCGGLAGMGMWAAVLVSGLRASLCTTAGHRAAQLSNACVFTVCRKMLTSACSTHAPFTADCHGLTLHAIPSFVVITSFCMKSCTHRRTLLLICLRCLLFAADRRRKVEDAGCPPWHPIRRQPVAQHAAAVCSAGSARRLHWSWADACSCIPCQRRAVVNCPLICLTSCCLTTVVSQIEDTELPHVLPVCRLVYEWVLRSMH